MKRFIAFLLIFFMLTIPFSQSLSAQESHLEKLVENYLLLNTEPEKAFEEAAIIEKEAIRTNEKEAELWAISTKCTYYKMNNDFENMMTSSKSLLKKATDYGMPTYQVMAKIDLFYVYMSNNLPQDALQQLSEGSKIIKNVKEADDLNAIVKSDLYLAYANYYSTKGESDKIIEYVQLSIAENDKLSDIELKQMLKHINYANLAVAYMAIEQYDQARQYAKLSLSSDSNFNRADVKLIDLGILGEISGYEKDYNTALYYYKEAEKLESTKSYLNLHKVYEGIIDCYRQLDDQENVKLYEAKRDSIKLSVSENQNKLLHNLLIENIGKKNNTLIYALGSALLLMILISFIIIRKNIILTRQEKASQKYLDELPEADKTQAYSTLLEMLKKNDPAFMLCFDETFPEFSTNLKALNPKISSSEVEFCALLKLKVHTKDIARYKFIEPTTVRNKKYLIKKKLHISNDMDIYQWFDSL